RGEQREALERQRLRVDGALDLCRAWTLAIEDHRRGRASRGPQDARGGGRERRIVACTPFEPELPERVALRERRMGSVVAVRQVEHPQRVVVRGRDDRVCGDTER